MSLVDPSPFLDKVDRSLYKTRTRKDTVSKQTSAVVYVEPRIPETQPTQASPNPKVRTNRETPVYSKWIISSKVQALGDFIDTDAVSIFTPTSLAIN